MKKVLLVCIFFGFVLGGEFNIDAIMDDAQHEEQTADIKLEKFTKDASESYGKLKKEYHDKYEYVPPSSNNLSAKKASFCHNYTIQSNGDKIFCLAFATNNKNLCHAYELTQRQRNICLGYCYESTLSKADKQYCLAIKNNNISYCYSLKGEYKKMCMGRFNKSNCYSLNSQSDKSICLGMSLN